MKKYYSITLLALIVIALLQGYNISLQYNDYIHNETDKLNAALKVAIEKEYALRAHTEYIPHKDGKQRLYTKVMTEEDFIKAQPKKEDILDFTEIDIQDLRDKGIAETEADAMGLMVKDRLTAKGKPINLSKVSQILKTYLGESSSYTLLIINENKKIIKSLGKINGTEKWQASKPIAIGLKPILFIKALVKISPSSFIINSAGTLFLTILLAIIVVYCVGYQMTVIKRKEELLENREVRIHGIIHDLKTPLASVLLTLGFIKDCINDIELKELLSSSEMKIQNLANTIKMILITAKADESKLIINKELVDIAKLAKQAQEQIDINYANKPHSIHIHDVRRDNEKIWSDRYLIESIICNLLENAVKYSEQDATVEICINSNEHFNITFRISIPTAGLAT